MGSRFRRRQGMDGNGDGGLVGVLACMSHFEGILRMSSSPSGEYTRIMGPKHSEGLVRHLKDLE